MFQNTCLLKDTKANNFLTSIHCIYSKILFIKVEKQQPCRQEVTCIEIKNQNLKLYTCFIFNHL